MSFAGEVRQEIAKIIPEKDCCCRAELAAMLLLRGHLQGVGSDRQFQLKAENAATIRKAYQLTRRLYSWPATVGQLEERRFNRTKIYTLQIRPVDNQWEELQELLFINEHEKLRRQVNPALLGRQCCRRAFLRGYFLCVGFINRPEHSYHLELMALSRRLALSVQQLTQSMGITLKQSERQGQLLLYLKDGEQIADFLRLIEASSALLQFENVRILRSMRNQVNRQVNCENANMDKAVNAAVKQVELIERLLQSDAFTNLPPGLREAADLRIANPEASLHELGQMMNPPLSKSGVAYRMRRLAELSEREHPHTPREN